MSLDLNYVLEIEIQSHLLCHTSHTIRFLLVRFNFINFIPYEKIVFIGVFIFLLELCD